MRRADEQSSVLVHKLVFGAESPVSFGGAARFQPRNDKIEAFLRLGFVGQRPFCRSLVGVKQAQCFEKRSCATSAWILQKQGDSVAPANDRLFRTSTDGVKESS